MSQDRIYEWFLQQRLQGDHTYYRVKQVYDAVRSSDGSVGLLSVRRNIWQLVRYGYLEFELTGEVWRWEQTFRMKQKYVKERREGAVVRTSSIIISAEPNGKSSAPQKIVRG
jgi:hypothetical protein